MACTIYYKQGASGASLLLQLSHHMTLLKCCKQGCERAELASMKRSYYGKGKSMKDIDRVNSTCKMLQSIIIVAHNTIS